jgi:uncharacterized protein
MAANRKIINDPVYGFITIDHPLLLQVIAHPYYQRLRNIHQMAFAHLVYPGAVHSRLHHSLGAYHLMCMALLELKSKGFSITAEEELGAKLAILLHDIGHGPYSHALENVLIEDLHHETISKLLMQELNKEFNGQLQVAIDIFNDNYPKKFLHQLVSGQLDVDRMDYLNRDSFFTGVSEGVIGYDRIIKMLTLYKDELLVEEKAIFSIEKFLLSRRLMYWQVYLHKTVLSAEMLLVRIFERAKELIRLQGSLPSVSEELDLFLQGKINRSNFASHLAGFCRLDDSDVLATVKKWDRHPDKILSLLCRCLTERKLFKVRLQSAPFNEKEVDALRKDVCTALGITTRESGYFVFTGEARNTTYNYIDERIRILFKNGDVKDISQVDNALIRHRGDESGLDEIKKYYICYISVQGL